MKRVSEPVELLRLSDLSDDELTAAYAPRREPWLRVNFVSTVDGAAQGSDGVSKSINNDADKRVFDALRANADCLVVGAGTLRAEGYDVPRLPLVVVSRSADLPPTLAGAPRGPHPDGDRRIRRRAVRRARAARRGQRAGPRRGRDRPRPR